MGQTRYTNPWVPKGHTHVKEGPVALPGTLPEREIITGGLLHHHASLWSDA
jgi:hypothetical protein